MTPCLYRRDSYYRAGVCGGRGDRIRPYLYWPDLRRPTTQSGKEEEEEEKEAAEEEKGWYPDHTDSAGLTIVNFKEELQLQQIHQW